MQSAYIGGDTKSRKMNIPKPFFFCKPPASSLDYTTTLDSTVRTTPDERESSGHPSGHVSGHRSGHCAWHCSGIVRGIIPCLRVTKRSPKAAPSCMLTYKSLSYEDHCSGPRCCWRWCPCRFTNYITAVPNLNTRCVCMWLSSCMGIRGIVFPLHWPNPAGEPTGTRCRWPCLKWTMLYCCCWQWSFLCPYHCLFCCAWPWGRAWMQPKMIQYYLPAADKPTSAKPPLSENSLTALSRKKRTLFHSSVLSHSVVGAWCGSDIQNSFSNTSF